MTDGSLLAETSFKANYDSVNRLTGCDLTKSQEIALLPSVLTKLGTVVAMTMSLNFITSLSK